jgi:hypothetical protein
MASMLHAEAIRAPFDEAVRVFEARHERGALRIFPNAPLAS